MTFWNLGKIGDPLHIFHDKKSMKIKFVTNIIKNYFFKNNNLKNWIVLIMKYFLNI
jgi:hypothetical protein